VRGNAAARCALQIVSAASLAASRSREASASATVRLSDSGRREMIAQRKGAGAIAGPFDW
jgi:hypothetical protein